MCHLNFTIDQSVHTLAPLFDLIDATTFCVRSIRLAAVAQPRKADVYLCLGGGSKRELDALVGKVRDLPAVQTSGQPILPIWDVPGEDGNDG